MAIPPPARASAGAGAASASDNKRATRDLADSLNYLPSHADALGASIARVRAVAFFAWTLLLSLPLFLVMLAVFPVVWVSDRRRRTLEHAVNHLWACLTTLPFFRIKVVGRENLPAGSSPAMYVANHQSFIDIYSLFHLWRFFKFVSKTSNFLIPVVGWSMYLTGHVGLRRTDKRSQIKVLQECRDLITEDKCSLLFFPEGTRSRTGRMAEFKKGAFSIAAKTGAPVVPITVDGAGPLMPSGREWGMWGWPWGRGVTLTVHPPISPNLGAPGEDARLCAEAQRLIASALPERLRPLNDAE